MSGLFSQPIPSGPFPFSQGIGTFLGPFQPQGFATNPFGSHTPFQFGPSNTPFAQQPLQQIVQSLLVVPQQLQQLLQLAQVQQQQVQYLLQSIPQQIQQLQHQLLQPPGFQSVTPHPMWGGPQTPYGLSQSSGVQPGHVM